MCDSTKEAYRTAWSRYARWAEPRGRCLLPVTEDALYSFAAAMEEEGLSSSTVKCYLSGIRFKQLTKGWKDPEWNKMPRLALVMTGMRRLEATIKKSRVVRRPVRRPVTPAMMVNLKEVWSRRGGADSRILWAACCVSYFGCLRAGEAMAQSRKGWDPDAFLKWVDLSWLGDRVVLHIRQSKTDRFCKGESVELCRTRHQLCPVEALWAYRNGRGEGLLCPLFRLETGRPLEIQVLVREVHRALKSVGVDPAGISGHSLRVGAATEAALQGSSDASMGGGNRELFGGTLSKGSRRVQMLAKAGKKTGDGQVGGSG